MNSLPPNTLRRLKKIPQLPNVWEGDRRRLHSPLEAEFEDQEEEKRGDCILWVDGSEGLVRSMDMVSSEVGSEAVVRALIQAIENPHGPAQPARPQKIVVRDRQLQFFLRGALQSLEIAIEYVPELPIIDHIFQSFSEFMGRKTPQLPPAFQRVLTNKALEIWDNQPWLDIADHTIMAIQLEGEEPLYLCVMGMLGQGYGVLLYRSLESLKRFRASISQECEVEDLDQVFFSQDCWFLNYESRNEEDEDEDEEFDLGDLGREEIRPIFGSIHPLEGMRPFLDEEECVSVYLALTAFDRFYTDFEEDFEEYEEDEDVPLLKQTYSIPLPTSLKEGKGKAITVPVTIETLPELAREFLLAIMGEDEEDNDEEEIEIRSDLVPDNCQISLGMLSWDILDMFKNHATKISSYCKDQPTPHKGDGFPVIVIQSTRPKAKQMIQRILDEGGLQAITYAIATNAYTERELELGILKVGNNDAQDQYYFFNDFPQNAIHKKAKTLWEKRCTNTKGSCGLIISMGVTGSGKGKVELRDMLAFFETSYIPAEVLGIGSLKIMHKDYETVDDLPPLERFRALTESLVVELLGED